MLAEARLCYAKLWSLEVAVFLTHQTVMAKEAAEECEALCVSAKDAGSAGFVFRPDETGSLKIEVLFEGSNNCNVKVTTDDDWPGFLWCLNLSESTSLSQLGMVVLKLLQEGVARHCISGGLRTLNFQMQRLRAEGALEDIDELYVEIFLLCMELDKLDLDMGEQIWRIRRKFRLKATEATFDKRYPLHVREKFAKIYNDLQLRMASNERNLRNLEKWL